MSSTTASPPAAPFALLSVRCARHPGRVILAVPVAPIGAIEDLSQNADEIVCIEPVERLGSVGAWYGDFRQVDDDQVTLLFDKPQAHPASSTSFATDVVRGRPPRTSRIA